MWKLLTQVFGSRNQRLVKELSRTVAAVNALEASIQALTDEQFPDKTRELKARFAAGTPLDESVAIHRSVVAATPADDPALADADLSPHVLRHSRAMHLYDGGVPLPYIRDILGHAELATTDIYARASTEAKRKALEAACTDIVSDDLPEWNQDPGLLSWLASL